MPTIPHQTLRTFGQQLFEAVAVPADQAAQASHHLVEANLVGHDSHGVIRIPNYVKALRGGTIKPVGQHKIVRESPASLTVDANGSFGIVMGYQAMQWAVDRAKQHTLGAVAVHQSSHIGRLGAFPPLAAEQNCIGILMLNGGSRFTAPFGGTGRRLPPNPIAISVPTLHGPAMMLDITTSVAAGGKVDVASARGKQLPEGWLVDAQGNSVTDPNLFRDGDVAMLPLGGAQGYKGYGLAMMIEAIAGGLSWAGCSTAQPTRGGSGWLALAIKIESFIDIDEYKQEIQKLIDWVKSSPTMPGVDKIYLPGEIEEDTRRQREAEGIYIEDKTWQALCQSAADVGVAVPGIFRCSEKDPC
ncbi:MAG TPA: Ldh family oxidoreductase [Caldilineaceae bacterium]|nr:Ldh family oxidoreductase [Caldilineaceae bacterium]